ncbi:hypothetical protein HEP73_03876 [Xanthomonas sp. GW]|uniref:hypothetical protein n=1 Tax=Xanthomonas sp. GW TaxID=2724121 RepID=UPI00163A1314|nr:hypothetical protein [Xanthomonas sp. GW]QNH22927.1 hypothetical protein HEP73_03876 [Xanthomonas sp. GW]
MQHARQAGESKVWEANEFSRLPEAELEVKRRSLECAECGEFAWFRKESRHGHPPHFCSHHAENCGLKVQYEVVGERAPGIHEQDQIAAGNTIVVRLDLEDARQVDVLAAPASNGAEGGREGGTRFVGTAGNRLSSQHFTLRRILYRLVQSPSFRTSRELVSLYRNENEVLIQGAVNDVTHEFSSLSREVHHDKLALYWGAVASAGRTSDGKLWLNSSLTRGGASIAIFDDIAKKFLDAFKVEDLEDLAGAHVLIAGRCWFSDSGKPVIRCSSVKFIVIRRYKESLNP